MRSRLQIFPLVDKLGKTEFEEREQDLSSRTETREAKCPNLFRILPALGGLKGKIHLGHPCTYYRTYSAQRFEDSRSTKNIYKIESVGECRLHMAAPLMSSLDVL